MVLYYLATGAAGVVAGGALGWLWAARGRGTSAGMEAELRRQLSDTEGRLARSADREKELIAAHAAAQAEREAAKALLETQKAAQEKSLADLKTAFEALSADALAKNEARFLSLAGASFAKLQESAKGDLAQKQEAIAGLLKPLEEQLKAYQQRLQQSETSQSETLGQVKQKLETLTQQSEVLARETERFRVVLKSNQARGRWGEETLRRVVEAAGMSAHCDFLEQAQNEDRKPDLLVRLPGNRVILVDAKVPDLDFLGSLEGGDGESRKALLKEHAQKLRATILDLSRREYAAQRWEEGRPFDYVILFLPAESLFSTALEGDGELIVWAAEKRITLATPSSLIALLRAVSLCWDQYQQTENAREIAEESQRLYKNVVTFMEHFGRIGKGLADANLAFNKAVSSYEARLRPSGERMLKLGVAAGGKELPEAESVETALRLPLDS